MSRATTEPKGATRWNAHTCTPELDWQRYAFNHTDCVWQPLQSVCPQLHKRALLHAPPRSCIPIEPLPLSDWRLEGMVPVARGAPKPRGTFTGTSKGWRPDKHIVYKPEIGSGFRPRNFRSQIYIDLGANTYASSIGKWFRTRYPDAERFRVYAFEPDPRFTRTYAGKQGVELLQYAAWTENATVTWSQDPYRQGGGGHVWTAPTPAGRKLAAAARPRRLVSHRALDIAEFISTHVVEEDYVVLKMDTEGAEHTLVPHLLRHGVARLIDEMFVEVHTEINSCCKPPNDVGRHFADAMLLVYQLRVHGVFAHPWS